MKLRTILTALLLLLLCLVMTVSCGKGSTNPPAGSDTSTAEPSGEGELEKIISVFADGAAGVTLVRANYVETSTLSIISGLREQLYKMTGVAYRISTDDETHNPDTFQIYVGDVDYPESSGILRQLKYNDYSVEVSGNKIVIAAHNDSALQKAVNYFLNLGIQKEKADDGSVTRVTFSSENKKEWADTYAIQNMSISGTEIYNYRIVYPEYADSLYKGAAYQLAQTIGGQTGYYLDVVSDLEAETPHEILLGHTGRSGEAAAVTDMHTVVSAGGGKLYIRTGGEFSVGLVGRRFFEVFPADAAGSVAIPDGTVREFSFLTDTNVTARADGTDMRIMSINILAEYDTWTSGGNNPPVTGYRAEIFLAHLALYDPDVAGLQEVSPEWVKVMRESLDPDKYALIGVDSETENSNFSLILYRCDRYKLVAWDTYAYSVGNNVRCRRVTWAVFEDRVTGQRFALANTHWDGDTANGLRQSAEIAATINGIAAQYKCPVFSTGDYNSNENAETYRQLMELTGMIDTKFTAENQINNIGSWHELNQATPSVNSCDHIFATTDCKVLAFQTLMYYYQIYASDHAWLYADIQFESSGPDEDDGDLIVVEDGRADFGGFEEFKQEVQP